MKNTKIFSKNYATLDMSEAERAVLGVACDLMGEVLATFGDGVELQSTETGECVNTTELMRVRGILDFFIHNPLVQMD
jgi:hypothetical protein